VTTEEVLSGDRCGLGAVVDTEFGVEAAELGFDGVVAHVEVVGELLVGHAGREQREQLAFSFGEADVSARPAQLGIDRSALRSPVKDDTLAPCYRADAVDDLGGTHCLGDEPDRAGFEDASYEALVVGKTEDDDGAGRRVSDKISHSWFDVFSFAVGVEQRDVDATARLAFDVDFYDADFGCVWAQKRAETFQDDLIVVLERDAYRPGHRLIL
jgi:hypothetical protein